MASREPAGRLRIMAWRVSKRFVRPHICTIAATVAGQSVECRRAFQVAAFGWNLYAYVESAAAREDRRRHRQWRRRRVQTKGGGEDDG